MALLAYVDAPSVATTAPAKINLTLDVLGRRADGYHELRSLVIGIDLQDELQLCPADVAGVHLACDDPSINDDSNLAVRAVRLLAERLGVEPAVTLRLAKRIAKGAGLGGGSSDAASALRLAAALWSHLWAPGLTDRKVGAPENVGSTESTRLTHDELAALGAALGSDVPLFFHLPAAVMTGRGDRVELVTLSWSGWVLLVVPDLHVSTADVYRAWRPDDGALRGADRLTDLRQARRARDLMPLLSNDLEPAVFRVAPRLARLHADLCSLLAAPVRVTGSGAALYLLCDQLEEAQEAARRVSQYDGGLCASVVRAPVGESPITCKESCNHGNH